MEKRLSGQVSKPKHEGQTGGKARDGCPSNLQVDWDLLLPVPGATARGQLTASLLFAGLQASSFSVFPMNPTRGSAKKQEKPKCYLRPILNMYTLKCLSIKLRRLLSSTYTGVCQSTWTPKSRACRVIRNFIYCNILL